MVACENGTRPAGVISYPAEDAERMASAVCHVLVNREAVAAAMANTEVRDTLSDEVALLTL